MFSLYSLSYLRVSSLCGLVLWFVVFSWFFSHTGLFPLISVFLFVCFLYFKTFLEGFVCVCVCVCVWLIFYYEIHFRSLCHTGKSFPVLNSGFWLGILRWYFSFLFCIEPWFRWSNSLQLVNFPLNTHPLSVIYLEVPIWGKIVPLIWSPTHIGPTCVSCLLLNAHSEPLENV